MILSFAGRPYLSSFSFRENCFTILRTRDLPVHSLSMVSHSTCPQLWLLVPKNSSLAVHFPLNLAWSRVRCAHARTTFSNIALTHICDRGASIEVLGVPHHVSWHATRRQYTPPNTSSAAWRSSQENFFFVGRCSRHRHLESDIPRGAFRRRQTLSRLSSRATPHSLS